MSDPPGVPEDDLPTELERAVTAGPPPTPPGGDDPTDFIPAAEAVQARRIGPYRIVGELGRGGMGIVWRGHDERLDRPVALKEITGALADDADGLRRFVREAKLLARLNHPHLATVYDLPESEGRPVLVMELLDGEDLSSRLKRGALGVPESLRLCAQVASGLEAAHSHGVIHRDLKPANVQVLASGHAKVLDFGLARQLDPAEGEDLTGAHVLAGTPGYMSPEQVRCEALDGRSDLFALGIILYECLTGARTYPGKSAPERFAAVLHGAPDWSRLPGDTTPSLRALLERCLAKDVESRIATARELREALEHEARGESAAAAVTTAADAAAADATRTAAPAPSTPRHSLPAERDEFVGRQSELAELCERWETGARLVTVLGSGGTGKTRLVRKHAWEQLAEYPGGAWFCDLSETRSLDGIAHAVASTLDVPLGKGEPLVQLGHAIAARGRCLIVLDNFEQAVEHAEAVLGPWLERCAEARLVVTSRERLQLTGEDVLVLEPLPLEDAAVELFELRACAQKANFRVGDDNRADVEEIVRLLDGLPLAIELAAARTRVLPPAKLKARLSDRFKLLVGKRGAEDRQSTLRAAIDWSWNLLEPWEQAALAQASVFEGGFTLEAADEVFDLSAFPDAPWPLDLVQLLLDKSLLRTWTPQDAGRRQEIDETYFGMYVSIHEYASEKLRTEGAVLTEAGEGWSGAEAERAAQGRHGAFFAAFGTDDALGALSSHGGVTRRRALALDLENLVAASRRAVRRDDGATAMGAYRAAWAVLLLSGPYAVACALGREVLALESPEPGARAPALLAAGLAAQVAGRMDEGRARYEEALAITRELGNRRDEGRVLVHLGRAHAEQGRMDEARTHDEQALAIARELGDRSGEGHALGNLAILHYNQGRLDEARAHFEQALAIARELGDRHHEGVVLGNLGLLHGEQGRMDAACAHHERALAIHREVGNRQGEGSVLINLGNVRSDQGRLDEGRAHYEQALAIHRELGGRGREGMVLGNLGNLHGAQGRMDESREHHQEALAIARELGDRSGEGLALGNLGKLHDEQGRPDEARAHYEEALSIARELGARVSEGITLGNLGSLHGDQGRLDEARAHHEAALAIAREVGNRRHEGHVLDCLGSLHSQQGRLDEAKELHEQALAIARELVNRRYEGHALDCLGSLHLNQGRIDEAKELHEQALAIARELGDRAGEGRVLGNLGSLHHGQGRKAEGREMLARGEALLRELDEGVQLANLLCLRGQADLQGRDVPAAREALAEAKTLAQDLGAGEGSALGTAITELEAALADTPES